MKKESTKTVDVKVKWIKPPRGTYVTRAAFTKTDEERKRLLRDISIMCSEELFLTDEWKAVILKWRKKFTKDKWLIGLLTDYAKTQKQNG